MEKITLDEICKKNKYTPLYIELYMSYDKNVIRAIYVMKLNQLI